MNKNRYKLIFSKTLNCLVPVAEHIKSAIGKSTKVTDADLITENAEHDSAFLQETNHSFLAYFVKSVINPISAMSVIKLPHQMIIAMSVIATPVLANTDTVVDPSFASKTQVKQLENKVLIVDIANPEHDGISDNRFSKLNVPNGAVFNNNAHKSGTSAIAGHIEQNKNLQSEAKAILNQVTGNEMSKLQGGLEVSGGKADLLIVNPNGVSLNGVMAINTDRFVVSTSNPIDPKNGLNLNVTQGNVIVEKNGVATNGLQYFDIVAKSIELNGAISHATDKNHKGKKEATTNTSIKLVAGSNTYDVKKRTHKEQDSASNQQKDNQTKVGISGNNMGAMYGKHIELIATDSGAGVTHQAAILSKSDIKISSKGDVNSSGTIKAANKVEIDSANQVSVKGDLSAQKAKINAKDIVLQDNTKVSTDSFVSQAANNVTLNEKTEISSKDVDITANQSVTAKQNSKISASENLTVASKSGQFSGQINANNATFNVDDFHNKGDIHANKQLSITVDKAYKNDKSINSSDVAKLQLGKDNQLDFDSSKHKLPQAKNKTIVTGNNATIAKGHQVESAGALKFGFKNSFNNNEAVISGRDISIAAINNIENNGFLGARHNINLAGSYIKNAGLIHTEKDSISLNAPFKVSNLGNILSGKDVNIYSYQFENLAALSGGAKFVAKGKKQSLDHREYYTIHYQYYTFDAEHMPEIEQNLSLSSIGRIKANGSFRFVQNWDSWLNESRKQKFATSDFLKETKAAGLDSDLASFNEAISDNSDRINVVEKAFNFNNQGIINAKEKLEAYGETGINNSPYFALTLADYLKTSNPIKITYGPWDRVFGTLLTFGSSERKHDSMFSLLDNLFKETTYFDHSLLYSGKSSEVLDMLKKIEDLRFQQAMTTLFGADWKTQKYDQLKQTWFGSLTEGVGKIYEPVYKFYPTDKAMLLSDNIALNISDFTNGDNSRKDNFDATQQIQVGMHTLDVAVGEIKPFVFGKNNNDGIDFDVLAELLANPYIFIDSSVQQSKPEKPPVKKEKQDKPNEDSPRPRVEKEGQNKSNENSPQTNPHVGKEKQSQPNEDNTQINPLYQTRLSYINQDDYFGSKYFFNKVATEHKGSVNTIGDNYFEHQLLSRSIEKKVGNHLNLKHNLTDVQLVKKLMDNSKAEFKNLGLVIGKALTEEQKASLKEDIIWYVKTSVNGKEVLVPQVYLAKSTLEAADKAMGQNSAAISGNVVHADTENLYNSGKISAQTEGNLKATNKVINDGGDISGEKLRIEGKRGVVSKSKSYIDEEGNLQAEKNAKIEAEKHVALIADKDADIDIINSTVKGKTGYISGKTLNIKDQHTYKSKSKAQDLVDQNGYAIGYRKEQTQEAKSEGSNVEFEQTHLGLHGDLNQEGSDFKGGTLTGIVKGKYNTKAGKNISHKEQKENISTFGADVLASFGGHSASASVSQENGVKTESGETSSNQAVARVGAKYSISSKEYKRTEVDHTNSQFEAEKGLLHILGEANIGGVDINKNVDVPAEENNSAQANAPAPKAETDKIASETNQSEGKEPEKKDNSQVALPKALTEEEIADLLEEKNEQYFAQQKEKYKDDNSRFELRAKKFNSDKEKNEVTEEHSSSTLSLGLESEAHSAVADAASHIAKAAQDAAKGTKQDGTFALQQVADIAKLATGELAGASVRSKLGVSRSQGSSHARSDNKTHIGGRTQFTAMDGDIDLTAVETNKNSDLGFKTQQSVNFNAAKTEYSQQDESVSAGVSAGANAGCSVIAGCNAGVSVGVEAGYSDSNAMGTSYDNTLIQGKKVDIEAGKDLNLNGANVDSKQLHLDVKGKTNVKSLQDSHDKTDTSFQASVTAGAAVSTQTVVKPTATIGASGGYSYESKKQIGKKSGIAADEITGTLHDVDMIAGYIVDRSGGKKLKIDGNVRSEDLKDYHKKDGGSAGGSLGINERGTVQANGSGSRDDQIHHEAEHQSTLAGVDHTGQTTGNVTDSLDKSYKVNRDEKIAGTNFEFEFGDLVDLAKKPLNKKSSKSLSNDNDTVSQEMKRRPLPDVPDSTGTGKYSHTESDYAEIDAPKAKSDVESTYAKAGKAQVDDTYATVQKSRSDKVTKENPLYGSSDEVGQNLAKRPLPEVPNANPKPSHSESDYAEIDAPKAKSDVESTYAKAGKAQADDTYATVQKSRSDKVTKENPLYGSSDEVGQNLAKRPLPEVPNANPKPSHSESDYAEIGIDKSKQSPEKANAGDNEIAVNTPAKTEAANSNVDTNSAAADTSGKSEKPSFFTRIKQFFSAGKKEKKAETELVKTEESVSKEPNYDDLEDNLNLKQLLALEKQRNTDFEQKVLQDEGFLEESREAAKKKVPEAVLKQMAGTPELDEILTDGAKKIEKKINDVVNFKPTEEDFAEIQALVKKLPKSEQSDDLSRKTDEVVEALAQTSKTIQRDPELKNNIRDAVEEFLKNSQGELTVEMIEKLNHGLRTDEGENRELYKSNNLTKEDAVFSSPRASKMQLAETVDFINKAKAQGVEPSVLAGLVYQRLIAYHPFAEGNGRMARVIVNKLLLDAGYPPFTKFGEKFEQTIIPQTDSMKESSTSKDVVKEFLRLLAEKTPTVAASMPEVQGQAM